MKSKVTFSPASIVVSIAVAVAAVLVLISATDFPELQGAVGAFFAAYLVFQLFYTPIFVKTDAKYLILESVLRSHIIFIADMESVELFQPTMGAVREFGSFKGLGSWGLFSEGDIGYYIAFYGKAAECFLVRMKNGDKYVIGCKDYQNMVAHLKELQSAKNVVNSSTL